MKKKFIFGALFALALSLILFGRLPDKTLAQIRTSFYPPTVDFENAVNAVLDKFFPDRIFDGYWKKIFHYITFFESIDNFGKTEISSATVTADQTEVTLQTSNSTSSEAGIFLRPLHQGLITFSQSSRFRTYIRLSATTSLTAHIVTGDYANTKQGYGFKITSSTLMGWTSNGSASSTIFLQNIQPNISYALEARYLPSKNVLFFSDDATATATIRQVGSLTTTLPSSSLVANPDLFIFDLKNGTNSTTSLKFSFFEYIQRRNILQ